MHALQRKHTLSVRQTIELLRDVLRIGTATTKHLPQGKLWLLARGHFDMVPPDDGCVRSLRCKVCCCS